MTETRRAFIGRVGIVLGAAPISVLATGCAPALVHRIRPDDGRIRLDLQSMTELRPEARGIAMLQVEGEDAPLFIVRQSDNTFFTMSSLCTHRGCTVEAKGDRFVCPCHGSTFSRVGDVTKGPAERPLRRYPTTLHSNGRTLEIDYRASGIGP